MHAHTKRSGKRVFEIEGKCSLPFWGWTSCRQVPFFFFFVTAFIDVIPNGDSFKRGLCDT